MGDVKNRELKWMYRGIVLETGPRGKCKIFVPGVHPVDFEKKPSALPWAEPALSLFGGNYTSQESISLNTETGLTGWPTVGAHLWLFFVQGDMTLPVYFAACQGGSGWISEHDRQWVINTENLRVRVDEKPSDPNSSSKFDSYNEDCTNFSKMERQKDVETTLEIEVKGNVNIKITGNVNLKVIGDVFEHIEGNKHETLIGNLFQRHVGDVHKVHEGSIVEEHVGDHVKKSQGNLLDTRNGNDVKSIKGHKNEIVSQTSTEVVGDLKVENYGNLGTKIGGFKNLSIGGESSCIGNGVINIRGSRINLN